MEIFATPLEATDIGMIARLDPDLRQAGVYQLTLTFNLQELHLEREKNNWVALIKLATYFPAATKPNGTEESIKLTLTEQRLRETLVNGYTLQQIVIAGEPEGGSARGDSGSCHRCGRFGEAAIGRSWPIESQERTVTRPFIFSS